MMGLRLSHYDKIMPETELVNIKIDGHELQVPKGEKIIESAKRIGVEVPFFCYHPRLSMEDGGANCRMCLVELSLPGPDGTVRKQQKPQTACSLPASEGKRHFPKAYPLSQHVVFDRERCIHCARCTRFTTDISGDAQLNFLKRGADMEVATFENTAYNSRFSGNVIELCPVGALLSRNYRFKARPWDLMTQNSICTQCSNGCNIKLDYRVRSVQRVNARLNEDVNE